LTVLLIPRSNRPIAVRDEGSGDPLLLSFFVKSQRLAGIASAKLNISHEE
jgi:hypothetical protein